MSKYLLDTHTFLWMAADSSKPGSNALTAILDTSTELLLSVASVWEMAIKVSLGKLQLPQPIESFVLSQLKSKDIMLLQIQLQHLAVVTSLPFHHRDPFDRLIAAQAMVEQLPIISTDAAFDAYAVKRFW